MSRVATLRTWHGPVLLAVPGLVFIGLGLPLIPQDWGWVWASVIAGCGLYLLLAGVLWRVRIDKEQVTIYDESLGGLLGRISVSRLEIEGTGVDHGILLHAPVVITRDGQRCRLRPLSRYRPAKALESSRRIAVQLGVSSSED